MLHSIVASVASAGVPMMPVDAGSTTVVGGSSVAAGHAAEAFGKGQAARVAADANAFGKHARPS